MNHQTKTRIFKLLDKLPAKMGYGLYHIFQNIKESKSFKQNIKSNTNTYTSLVKILNSKNLSIEGKEIIEIGSGWIPAMPYEFLYKGKAKKIYTYDLNKHYQKNKILKFNKDYFADKNFIKFDHLEYAIDNRIKYFPNQNIIFQKLNKVDFVFSRFVLEHVTPYDLFEMHKKFYNEFDNKTKIIHFISPSDHRAFSDKSISLQDFLKYSQDEWNRIQTKFDYHNRLRLPQYIEIFKSTGFEIEFLSYDNPDVNSETFAKFKKIKINTDFNSFSDEELTAGSLIVILKKNDEHI